MFENAELGNKVDRETYQAEEAKLRPALLATQRQLAEANFAVIVVVAGVEGAGKSEAVNLLLSWLDARGIQTHAMIDPGPEETLHPPMWRFWQALPPRGHMAIFFGAWDVPPLLQCFNARLSQLEFDREIDRVVDFERMLHQENILVVKYWLHLSRVQQKKALTKLEADPYQHWRVTKREWKQHKHYDQLRALSEHLIRRTNTAEGPWTIVEAADKRYRNLTIARTLLERIQARLEQCRLEPPRPAPQPVMLTPPPVNVINQLDMSLALDGAKYKKDRDKDQGELGYLTRQLGKCGRSLILLFEGNDAAGKGGSIRRLTEAMDARDYRVISIAAPTDEERAHPYLWRFWRHLPPRGRATIYDRSWYGRVLVERVEGFAQPQEWQRAFAEINAFEEQLGEFGIIVLKFWLAITPEEQLKRFQDRQTTPFKQYKITPEDWRNRQRWASYEAAACDMIEKTNCSGAPWVLVEANNKDWARVKVLQTVVRTLKKELGK